MHQIISAGRKQTEHGARQAHLAPRDYGEERNALALDSEAMLSKSWFELGWDFASFNLALPPRASRDMQQGWKEGTRRTSHRVPTKHELKWLRLRFGALERNKAVDPSVTPALLEAITPAVCPVLTIPLTCGTGSELDWSVDRVFNGAAYSAANICIMSVKANRSKGSLDIHAVCERAAAAARGRTAGALSAKEWARLASIMVGPHWVATGEMRGLPQSTIIPIGLSVVGLQVLQQQILSEVLRRGGEGILGRLRDVGSATARKELHRLVQAIRHKASRNRWVFDVWLESGVFTRLLDWLALLSAEDRASVTKIMLQRLSGYQCVEAQDDLHYRWALDTGGYRADTRH
jgi:hypothetical protein